MPSIDARVEKATARLDLMSHFEATFDRILKANAHRPHTEIAEALSRETVSFIEGYDEFLMQENEKTGG